MIRQFARSMLILTLALILGAGAALQNAAQAAAGVDLVAMVICGEGGDTTVYVDASGNPVDPARHCPDPCAACILAAGYDVPGATAILVAPGDMSRRMMRPAQGDLTMGPRAIPALARGPPTGEVPE